MNTPKAPLEASGTSGMKAAINGIPNFSVFDGWWSEGITNYELRITNGKRSEKELRTPHLALDTPNGWGFEGATEGSQQEQDRSDSARMYAMLETEIVPRFYDKGLD